MAALRRSLSHATRFLQAPVVPSCVSTLARTFAAQVLPASDGPELPFCDFQPPSYTGPSKEETLQTRKQYLNPGTRQFLPQITLYVTTLDLRTHNHSFSLKSPG